VAHIVAVRTFETRVALALSVNTLTTAVAIVEASLRAVKAAEALFAVAVTLAALAVARTVVGAAGHTTIRSTPAVLADAHTSGLADTMGSGGTVTWAGCGDCASLTLPTRVAHAGTVFGTETILALVLANAQVAVLATPAVDALADTSDGSSEAILASTGGSFFGLGLA